jgi:CopG family nickel-responsive transcriptional regulator
MQRITITVDDDLADALDALVGADGWANRSEAVRDLCREGLARRRAEADGAAACVGVLSYVYDHDRRDLARTLTHAHHDHHHRSLSTLHLHLDARTCLEVAVLQGPVAEIRRIADRITAERGVRFGRLRLLLLDGEGDADGREGGPG